MNSRKRKSSTTGSRQKRVLNLESHELPDIEGSEGTLWRSPGKEKKQRKWKEGSRSKRKGAKANAQKGSSVGPATSETIPATGGQEDGLDSSAGSTGLASFESLNHDHEDNLDNHESLGGLGPSDAVIEDSDATMDDDSDSDYDYDLETYAEAVNTNVAGYQPVFGRLFVVQGWNSSRSETTVRLTCQAHVSP